MIIQKIKQELIFATCLALLMSTILLIHASALYCDKQHVGPGQAGMFCWLENDPTKPDNINY